MSIHQAPLHRPVHHWSMAEGMLILIIASIVILMVVAVLTIPGSRPAQVAVAPINAAAAEQARLEFRRGEWYGTSDQATYLAEQARLDFRRGEWNGTQLDAAAAERARLEFRRGEWYAR